MNLLLPRSCLLCAVAFCLASTSFIAAGEIYVDGGKGNDSAVGSSAAPLRTLATAVAKLPAEIKGDFSIHVSGEIGAAAGTLELSRTMRQARAVRIVGDGPKTILNWTASDEPLIAVTQGRWSLENLQIGSRQKGQRRGVLVIGPATVELHSVRIHTASQSAPGIHATRGGLVELFGDIELNEDLHENAGSGESFCGIVADYGGVVRFRQREKASLSLGNGSLGVSYYGVIELGCSSAKVTSWHDQANVIAVNNSGRVDLHSTPATLAARNPRNTPIGLEDDGHVLAEGAPITIRGYDNGNAIVLQKASAFFCNDVTFEGKFHTPLSAMSGSTMLIGVIGDLDGGEVLTGARIILEKCTGKLTHPINATSQGVFIDSR